MNISYHKDFIKDFKKLGRKQKNKFNERQELFEQDQFNLTLNNHPLKGNYLGYRSINITGDLRAIFKQNSENDVTFVVLDSHSNLYR
jgi:addiction module RelE/StbE family toxin